MAKCPILDASENLSLAVNIKGKDWDFDIERLGTSAMLRLIVPKSTMVEILNLLAAYINEGPDA